MIYVVTLRMLVLPNPYIDIYPLPMMLIWFIFLHLRSYMIIITPLSPTGTFSRIIRMTVLRKRLCFYNLPPISTGNSQIQLSAIKGLAAHIPPLHTAPKALDT